MAPPPTIPLDLQAALAGRGGHLLSLSLTGLPAQARLTAGIDLGRGRWHVAPEDVGGLGLILPAGGLRAPLRLRAEATARQADGSIAAATALIEVGGPAVPGPVPLPIDGMEGESLRIGGLPPGARLSIGTSEGNGIWRIPAERPEGVALEVPPGFAGRIELTIGGTRTQGLTVEFPGPGGAPPPPAMNLTARLVPISRRRPTRLESRAAAPLPDPQDLPAAEAEIARLRGEIGDLRDELEEVRRSVQPHTEKATEGIRARIVELRVEAGDQRDRLEALRDARAGAIAEAVAATAPEIEALKATAQDRRDRLEETLSKRAGAIEKATTALVEEAAGLRGLVQDLRDRAEAEILAQRQARDEAGGEAGERTGSLRETVARLRDQLDERRRAVS